MAIITAFQQWRIYIEGTTNVKILTDHKNLIYFTTIKQLNKKQIQWLELLKQYKFKIIYILGKDNQTADGLNKRLDLY